MDDYLLAQHSGMEESHWWFAGRKQIIASVLQRWVDGSPRPRHLLDVGCGAGSMIGSLSLYGRVTAVDTSPEAIEHVRARYPGVATVTGDLPEALTGLEGPFDVVTALDVIEHIDDDRAALSAIRSNMRPGGLLLCTVPAFQWMWGPHDELNGHKRRYDQPQLSSALSDAGFSVDWISYYNTLLFPPVAAVRLARRLFKADAPASSDFDVPVGPMNGLLYRLFRFERHLLRRFRLPFGSSLITVARNPA